MSNSTSKIITPELEYGAVIAALLHDIGKILQRLDEQQINGTRDALSHSLGQEYGDLFKKCVDELYRNSKKEIYKHECYSICFIRILLSYLKRNDSHSRMIIDALEQAHNILHALTFKKSSPFILRITDELKRVLLYADIVTAAERGPVEKRAVYEKLSKIHGLKPQEAPFTSPLWLWKIKNLENGAFWDRFTRILEQLDMVIDRAKLNELLEELKSIITKANIFEENFFIEPKTIKWSEMTKWRIEEEVVPPYSFKPFNEAKMQVNYESIVSEFMDQVKKLLDLASNSVIGVKGFIETLLVILKSTLFLTPAGVYGSLLPDTSIYAHSKATASIIHTYIKQRESGTIKSAFKLLGIDINGIQRFIGLISQHKAASKIFRGKSLYIELLQRALTSYLLDELGLTWVNVLGYEGGKVILAVQPAALLSSLTKTVMELEASELMNELGITLAESSEIYEPITLKQLALAYSGDIKKLRPGTYAKALLELRKALLKSRYTKEFTKLYMYDYEFDRLTHTPIPKGRELKVEGDIAEYINELAPGAFEPTSTEEYYSPRRSRYMSSLTHNILVLGHVARNLTALIELKIKARERYKVLIKNIVNELNKTLLTEKEPKISIRRMWRVKVGDLSLRIGLVEFPTLNIAYILVAQDPIGKIEQDPWNIIIPLIRALLLKPLLEIMNENDILRIIIINRPEKTLPSTDKLGELKVLGKLVDKGIEISLDYWFTNTYHPIKIENDGIKIKDIDEIIEDFRSKTGIVGLFSIAKIDGDRIGELFRLIASSPSRYIALSELLQFYFGGLGYTLMEGSIRDSSGEPKVTFKENVIVLYGGGDDIVLYGSWLPVIYYLIALRLGMNKVLYPLTASGAVVMDYSKSPIALNYKVILNHLEQYAKEFDQRNSIVLFKDPLPYVYEYSIQNTEVKIRYGIPYEDLDELKSSIEEVLRWKPEPGTLYKLYTYAQRVSKLVDENIKLTKSMPRDKETAVKLHNYIVNELLAASIELQYNYARVLREEKRKKEIIRYIRQFNEIADKLDRGEALEALLRINRKLPLLAIVLTSSRS